MLLISAVHIHLSFCQGIFMLPTNLARIRAILDEAAALTKQVGQSVALNENWIPSAEAQVIRLLDENGPASVPQLGRLRNTSRQNTQVLINRLVKEGLVELIDNPVHKRSPLVRLTETGRLLPSKARAAEAEMLERLAGIISAEELETATAVLAALRKKLLQGQCRRRKVAKRKRLNQAFEEELPVSLL